MMVERQIDEILQAGIDWFVADSRRVERFFLKQGLTATEAAKVRTYFDLTPADGDHGGPPSVVHGHPRTTGPFPCYAIILSGDPFSQTYLGDDIDDELLDEDAEVSDYDVDLDDKTARQIGHMLNYQFDIEVWAFNSPDICLYYYHLLRYIVFSSLQSFEDDGLSQVEFAGRDINPFQRGLPENMWVRALRLTAIGEEKAWETLARGSRISGAHVEGGPEDDTTVTRGIVPYTE